MIEIYFAAFVFITAGILSLMYGSFNHTGETHGAENRKTANVPVWAGVGAIILGSALLIFGQEEFAASSIIIRGINFRLMTF